MQIVDPLAVVASTERVAIPDPRTCGGCHAAAERRRYVRAATTDVSHLFCGLLLTTKSQMYMQHGDKLNAFLYALVLN